MIRALSCEFLDFFGRKLFTTDNQMLFKNMKCEYLKRENSRITYHNSRRTYAPFWFWLVHVRKPNSQVLYHYQLSNISSNEF